jgi:hypothetical protein
LEQKGVVVEFEAGWLLGNTDIDGSAGEKRSDYKREKTG